MVGRIPQGFIDELMRRVDIVDVIEARVQLRKIGRDFQARCPFHEEKTPSFTVSPEKQFYHCFGCGAHGTAIGFLMAYEHMEFVEAVQELAAQTGLEVPKEAYAGTTASEGGERELYDTLSKAADYFSHELRVHPQGVQAIAYLKGRGLTGLTAVEFGLGYAPPGWDHLGKALGTTPQMLSLLIKAGLLVERDQGGHYDRFRHRIMFPIRDHRGRIIGFGGRVLDNNDTPKYLNSPETAVFHKGHELYGLYEARKSQNHPPRLIVVEGYMDVISLAQHGIKYAVATLGTATTPEHLTRLFRATSEVVFCFDGDRAGRDAAWRALQITLPLMRDGRQVRFMFLPEGEDPDTLVQKEGQDHFEARIAQSVPLSNFLFEGLARQTDTTSMEGRARLVELARPLLSNLPPGILRHLAVERLAQITHLDPKVAARVVTGNPQPVTAHSPTPPRNSPRPGSPVRIAIALLLQRPELAQRAGDPKRFEAVDVPGTPLLKELLELLQTNPSLTPAAILERWRTRDEADQLTRLALWQHPVPEDGLEAEFDAALKWVNGKQLEQRLEWLLGKASHTVLNVEEKAELLQLLAATPGRGREITPLSGN